MREREHNAASEDKTLNQLHITALVKVSMGD